MVIRIEIIDLGIQDGNDLDEGNNEKRRDNIS